MAGLIGKKIGMTSVFDEEGRNVPCTLIEAGPCAVTQVKNQDNDGYEAVQLGYGDKKAKRTSAALMGHFKKAKTEPKRVLKEFDPIEGNEYKAGDEVSLQDVFNEGEIIDVQGITKGKGFQGVVKRHNFSGVGGQTHGQHDQQRHPGAIGGCSDPSRVFKGMKMAGRTGNNKVLMENLRVMRVLPEKNLIVVKGSVPGAKQSHVYLLKR